MISRRLDYSIQEAFLDFLDEKQTLGLKDCSIRAYQQSFDYFILYLPISSSDPVSSLNQDLIHGWIISLKQRNISLASINHYLAGIRVFHYYLMKRDLIKPFKIHLVKGQKSSLKYYSDSELSRMIQKPPKNSSFVQYRTWVCVCFILATGARASTLVNIKISDIDFLSREITYRHLKNKDIAIIPLSESLAKTLKDYLSEWHRTKTDGWLFCDESENQASVSSLRQALHKYCDSLGVQSKGLHALRHSFARGYILNGGNAFKLQKILTHQTVEMTRRYVQLFGEDLKRDYEVFSPLDNLSNSKKKSIVRN